MRKIKVLIADEDPTFKEGMRELLNEQEGLEVIGRAANSEEAVRLTRELRPDVAIIDINMPGLNGINVTKKIKLACSETEVLALGANSQNQILTILRAAGVGYITRDTPIGEVTNSVRLANIGNVVLKSRGTKKIIRRKSEGYKQIKTKLDLFPRELEVLKLTARGQLNKEIARDLKISERTVQAHLSNIFGKLDVNSRAEAVLQALQDGWLDLKDLA